LSDFGVRGSERTWSTDASTSLGDFTFWLSPWMILLAETKH